MSVIKNAEYYRDQSKSVNTASTSALVLKVEAAINSAAKQGKYACSVHLELSSDDNISREVVNVLKFSGFEAELKIQPAYSQFEPGCKYIWIEW